MGGPEAYLHAGGGVFHASQRRVASSGANRWLLLAGLGLLVLGLVLRMMLDIGAVGGSGTADTAAVDAAAVTTAVVDTAAVDTAGAMAVATDQPTTPLTTIPPQTAYTVQLGLFSQQANAEGIKTRAAALGYTATVHPLQRGTRTLYRVSVDGIPTSDAAKQAADSLSRGLKINGVVVTRHGD